MTLFALGRYDDAAAALYAVLAVGPGWDWTSFVGLYPNVSVYTDQFRALERYVGQNPNSASARFVLAYLYLTQGDTSEGIEQLKRVVALQPKDTVAEGILRRLAAQLRRPRSRERAPWLGRRSRARCPMRSQRPRPP